MIERLTAIEVSALCDADKALPVVDPAIRAMVPDVRFAGPALPVEARDDHLPVMSALAEAAEGDVLVVGTGGGRWAVLGELFATEARRRGLAGIVIDGFCRDVAGLRRVGLPVFARGTVPRSGTVVSPGDVVFGDDDGVVIAPSARIEKALDAAEAIGRAEAAILDGIRAGRPLHDQTTWAEHVARLDAGEPSALGFRP